MTEGILVSCLSLHGRQVFTNLKDVLIKLLQKLDERVGLSKFVEIKYYSIDYGRLSEVSLPQPISSK